MNDWQFICSILGAMAWIPIIFSYLSMRFRKISGKLLDLGYIKQFNYNCENLLGERETKTGTLIIIAFDFFVEYTSYAITNAEVYIELNDNTSIIPILADTNPRWWNTKRDKQHRLNIPYEYNWNNNNVISKEQDNIRIFLFLCENKLIESMKDIRKISLNFYNGKACKNYTLRTADLAGQTKGKIIEKYTELVYEHE